MTVIISKACLAPLIIMSWLQIKHFWLMDWLIEWRNPCKAISIKRIWQHSKSKKNINMAIVSLNDFIANVVNMVK